MRYALRKATKADRAFAERLHYECYKEVVICKFGTWEPVVQRQFFAQSWRPERYDVVALKGEPIGVLVVNESSDPVLLSEIQISVAHQGNGLAVYHF